MPVCAAAGTASGVLGSLLTPAPFFPPPQAEVLLARFPTSDVVITQVFPRANPFVNLTELTAQNRAVPRWPRVDDLSAAMPAALAAVSQPRRVASVSCNGTFLVR